MVRSFVSKTWPLPLNGAGGHQSLLSSLSPYCIPRLSPLLCSYPNKLAIQVSEGGRKRWRRVWSWVGGWALWRTSRLSVGEVHGTLKRLCLNTHTHTSTNTVSQWLDAERERGSEREAKSETLKINERLCGGPQTSPLCCRQWRSRAASQLIQMRSPDSGTETHKNPSLWNTQPAGQRD